MYWKSRENGTFAHYKQMVKKLQVQIWKKGRDFKVYKCGNKVVSTMKSENLWVDVI